MSINEKELRRIRRSNRFHAILLLAIMAATVAILGYWLFGGAVAILAAAVLPLLMMLNSIDTITLLLRAYRARPISASQAPDLHRVLQVLSDRAGLTAVPLLVYLPMAAMTAFASGKPERSVIALSDGLLRRLEFEDLVGVLAHEISHVRHEDYRILQLADILGHVARSLCFVGQILLIILLPSILLGFVQVSLVPVLLLICTPLGSALLQLALSRNREMLADLSAAQLMGNSRPLMSALIKLDRQNAYWERYLGIARESKFLRTHPKLEDRLQLLQSVELQPHWQPMALDGRFAPHWDEAVRRKRWW